MNKLFNIYEDVIVIVVIDGTHSCYFADMVMMTATDVHCNWANLIFGVIICHSEYSDDVIDLMNLMEVPATTTLIGDEDGCFSKPSALLNLNHDIFAFGMMNEMVCRVLRCVDHVKRVDIYNIFNHTYIQY